MPSLASAYARVGRVEEGLAVLAEALTVVSNTEIRVNEAELYRLKGELTLQQENKEQRARSGEHRVKSKEQRMTGKEQESEQLKPNSQIRDPHGEAEACFLKAIEISQQQQAKSLELRAVMSLAHLWRTQGKKSNAHRKLSGVYGWFTEGFDTKDLQKAKALLKQLS